MSVFAKSYVQGIFIPKHKEKCYNYNGMFPNAKPITFRSSWEKILCNFCDRENNILAYGSEVLEIPYYSELDGKTHRYITDFIMITQCRDGSIKKYVIEVKPANQVARLDEHGNLIMPDVPKKLTQKKLRNWQERCNIIRRNNEKWTAARIFCNRNGYIFKVITEKELGLVCK